MFRRYRIRAMSFVLFVFVLGFGAAAGAVTRQSAAQAASSRTVPTGKFLWREIQAFLGSFVPKNGASLDPFGQPKPESTSTEPGRAAGSSESSGQ